MRRILSSTCIVALLLVAALLLAAAPCWAQKPQTKPLVTISFSGYDELMTDIGYIGKLAGNPDMAKGLDGMLTLMTQGKGLAGLDKSRPWGAVVSTDGQTFPVYVFVPVTDLKELMGVLAALGVEAEEGEEGVWEVSTPAMPLFVKQKGKWAFIAQTPDGLGNLPDDPTTALDGLNKKYDLAVRASVKNIPPMFRQMVLSQLAMGMGQPQTPGESAEQYAMRKAVGKNAIKQITTLFDELDELLVGWKIEGGSQAATLDIEVTAIEGTNTAEQFAQMADAKSSFSGVNLPGAAVVATWAGMLTDSDVSQFKAYLNMLKDNTVKELDKQNLPEDQLKLAKQIIGDLMDVLEKTIDNKKSDGGMVLLLDPEAVTVVVGSVIADGAKLESTLKLLAAEVQKDSPELSKMFKLDAETHDGVRFHVLNIPVPERELVPMVGETLEVVVAIGDDRVYLAGGRNAAATLKKVMDGSKATPEGDAPPLSISISATPVAKFIAAVADEDQVKMMAGTIAGMLQATGGKDHVTITSTSISNGVRMRVTIEEGILKVIGTVSQMMGPGGPGGPGGLEEPESLEITEEVEEEEPF